LDVGNSQDISEVFSCYEATILFINETE
jgi:hypothetical protein